MERQPYPAARAVAPALHEHFARHRREAPADSAPLAPLPDVATVEALVGAAFWASLRREEGYVPRISLAYLPPPAAADAFNFDRPQPLDPAALAKMAPAVERPGIHLGVWGEAADLSVWGATRQIPALCFVLEVAAPGLLVVKHHRAGDVGKYVNVAVLEGDQIKLIDEHAASLPDCPSLLTSLLGFDAPASWVDSVNILVQLAASMRAHGRGGALLVVPPGSQQWRDSIVHPMLYALVPPFTDLCRLAREMPAERPTRAWQAAIARAVDAVAGLTAVDGATIVTSDYDVLAFGAKIVRRRGAPQVEQVTVTEPILGGTASIVEPVRLGGTRHFSAAQFIQDQRDAVALVASQDGRFTIFAWSPCEATVHAHRVETLLL